MRTLLLLASLLFAFSVVAAQQHTDWQEFRYEADGFSVEMPGSPKISTRDLGQGASQKFFTFEIGQETYMVSVIQLPAGSGTKNPDEDYFARLMKAYVEGSGTTLRSSRMTTWVGHPAMEGVSDAEAASHLIDMTAVGDRLYLIVFAGAKGQETAPKATHMRDAFKLLGN